MKFSTELFDTLTEQAKVNPRLRQHFDLRDGSQEQSMRMLNALEPGTDVPIHKHSHTSEQIVCVRGRVRVETFTEQGDLIEGVEISPAGECCGLWLEKGVYHRSVSLESGSVIIEFKTTKYDPATCEEFLNK